MASSSQSDTYTPSAATIPPWPTSCINVSGVYKNCGMLTNAWTTSSDELMPESISDHADAVKNTASSLMDLFDITWGGNNRLFSYIVFRDINGNIYENYGTWKNHQRVNRGESATPPATSPIPSSELYNIYWEGNYQNIIPVYAEENVYFKADLKKYSVKFYDMFDYDRNQKPKGNALNPMDNVGVETGNAGTYGIKFPDEYIDHNQLTREWYDSPTGGNKITTSCFNPLLSSVSAYCQYTVNAGFHTVSAYYFTGDDNVECSSIGVQWRYSMLYTNLTELSAMMWNKRNGYTFNGRWTGDDTNLFKDVTASFATTAKYDKNIYTIGFYGGYDKSLIAQRSVGYKDTVDVQGISYGNEYPNVVYYGWDDWTKYTEVTANASVSSLYRVANVDNSGFFYTSYLTSYTVSGHISEGQFDTVTLSTDNPEVYGLDNLVKDGNKFTFSLIKDAEKDDWIGKTKTFNVSAKDENGKSYIIPFSSHVNYNNIKLYFNNESVGESTEKTAWERDKAIVDTDCWGNPIIHMINPDENQYMGPYLSCSNYGKNGKSSIMRIEFSGYDSISFYIKNCGDTNKDYPVVGKLNTKLSETPLESEIYASFKEATTSGDTGIEYYNKVTYGNLDFNTTYFIEVAYIKNEIFSGNADRSYLLINVPEQRFGDEDPRCYVKFDKTTPLSSLA